MQTSNILTSIGQALGYSPKAQSSEPSPTPSNLRRCWRSGCLAVLGALSLSVVGSPVVKAQSPGSYANLPSASTVDQQYVVIIGGSSTELLGQIQQVEPEAFITRHQGRSVIQAGRYSYLQNAQQRQQVLSGLGIGAEIAPVVPLTPTIAAAPTSPVSYGPTEQLPPLPVVAVPGAAPPPPTAAPTTLTAAPPTALVTAPPAQGVAAAPRQQVAAAPYYVVVPTSHSRLTEVSRQLIQLGAPATQVQARTAPRGPHVAVGPFRDRNLAQDWSNFFRGEGYRSSRVHFER